MDQSQPPPVPQALLQRARAAAAAAANSAGDCNGIPSTAIRGPNNQSASNGSGETRHTNADQVHHVLLNLQRHLRKGTQQHVAHANGASAPQQMPRHSQHQPQDTGQHLRQLPTQPRSHRSQAGGHQQQQNPQQQQQQQQLRNQPQVLPSGPSPPSQPNGASQGFSPSWQQEPLVAQQQQLRRSTPPASGGTAHHARGQHAAPAPLYSSAAAPRMVARRAAAPRGPRYSSAAAQQELLAAWPESGWMRDVGDGVRIKGARLARMMDGIQPTAVPDMFRVHSMSGAAEWWPTDLAACICSCPNDSDMCSHLFGVAVLHPKYRPKLALLMKARELVRDAALTSRPIAPVIDELAAGLGRQMLHASMPTLADACQVAAASVVALLLQGVCSDQDVYGAGHRFSQRRQLWWQAAAQELGGDASVRDRLASACDSSSSSQAALLGALTRVLDAALAEALVHKESVQKQLHQVVGSGRSSDSGTGGGGSLTQRQQGTGDPAPPPADTSAHSMHPKRLEHVFGRTDVAAVASAAQTLAAAEEQSTASPVPGTDSQQTKMPKIDMAPYVEGGQSVAELLLTIQEAACHLLGIEWESGLPEVKVAQADLEHSAAVAKQAVMGTSTPPPTKAALPQLSPDRTTTGRHPALPDSATPPASASKVDKRLVRRDLLGILVGNGQLRAAVDKLLSAVIGARQLTAQLKAAREAANEERAASSKYEDAAGQATSTGQGSDQGPAQIAQEEATAGTPVGKGPHDASQAQPGEELHASRPTGVQRVSLSEVQAFVSQAASALSSSAQDQAALAADISAAACAQFGVHSFSDLGWGPDPLGLITSDKLGSQGGVQQGDVGYAYALLLGAIPLHQQPDALRQPFALMHSLASSASPTGGHCQRVQLGGAPWQCIWVDLSCAGVDRVAAAVSVLDGQGAVQSLLATLVVHGGVLHMPLALLLTACTAAVKQSVQTHAVAQAAAAYVADILTTLPFPFQECLELLQVLMPAFLITVAETATLDLVLNLPTASLRESVAGALAHMGSLLGAPEWAGALEAVHKQQARQTQHKAASAAVNEVVSVEVEAVQGGEGDGAGDKEGSAPPPPSEAVPESSTGGASASTALTLSDLQNHVARQGASAAPPAAFTGSTAVSYRGPLHVSPDVAKAVIDSIRQQEFGIGLDAGPEVAGVLRAQHARLRRALERLAADLYASQVHLLLELLQNADDTTFDKGSGVPTLGLWVGQTGVAAVSNERGFTEKDVRALCDVGASSKLGLPVPNTSSNTAASRAGMDEREQTGEKGVGFKSVFAVTDCPHISSNGYSFKFDAQDPTGIGMVLPTWVAQPPQEQQDTDASDGGSEAASLQDMSSTNSQAGRSQWPVPPVPPDCPGWTTHIWLPVAPRLLVPREAEASTAATAAEANSQTPGRQDEDSSAWSRLSSELLGEVSPALLLHLRRVRRLVVEDARGQQGSAQAGDRIVHVLTRTDSQGGGAPATAGTSVTQVRWELYILPPAAPSPGCLLAGTLPPAATRTFTWVRGTTVLSPPPVPRRSAPVTRTVLEVTLPLELTSPTSSLDSSSNSNGNSAAELAGVTASTEAQQGVPPSPGPPQVYAFLPVRPVGLPFNVHADWLLPSSREDVLAGEAWNQALRERVGPAFTAAVHAAVRHPRTAYTWLAYLPNPSAHVQSFFRPLVHGLPLALRTEPVIATTAGTLVRPLEAILAAKEVRDLVPEALLWQVLRKHYVHPQLAGEEAGGEQHPAAGEGQEAVARQQDMLSSSEREAMLASLGVRSFSARDLLTVLEAVGPEALLAQAAQQQHQHSQPARAAGEGGAQSDGTASAAPAVHSPVTQSVLAWRLLALIDTLLPAAPHARLGEGGRPVRSHRPDPDTAVLLAAFAALRLVPVVGGSLVPASSDLFLPEDLDAVHLPALEAAEVQAEEAEQQEEGDQKGQNGLEDGPVPSPGAGGLALARASSTGAGGLDSQLQVVDMSGLHALSSMAPALWRPALHCLRVRMHVRALDPLQLITRHILPTLAAHAQQNVAEAWKGKESLLVGFASYLLHHQHLALGPEELQAWRGACPLVLVAPKSYATPHPHAEDGDGVSPQLCNTGGSDANAEPSESQHTCLRNCSSDFSKAEVVPAAQGISMAATHWVASAVGGGSQPHPPASTLERAPSAPTSHPLVPEALASVMTAALGPCALHPAYLQTATPDQWAAFLGHTVLSGPVPAASREPAAGQGDKRGVHKVQGYAHRLFRVHAVQRQLKEDELHTVLKQCTHPGSAEGYAEPDTQLQVLDYMCDLQTVLDYLAQGLAQYGSSRVGTTQTMGQTPAADAHMEQSTLLQAATQLWEVVSQEWDQSGLWHAAHCCPPTAPSTTTTASQDVPASAQLQAAVMVLPSTLLLALKHAPCLPLGFLPAAQLPNHLSDADEDPTTQQQQHPRTHTLPLQVVSPAEGCVLLPTPDNLALFGPAALYSLPHFVSNGLAAALGLVSAPADLSGARGVRAVLAQLGRWSQAAPSPPSDATAAEHSVRPASQPHPTLSTLTDIYQLLLALCQAEDKEEAAEAVAALRYAAAQANLIALPAWAVHAPKTAAVQTESDVQPQPMGTGMDKEEGPLMFVPLPDASAVDPSGAVCGVVTHAPLSSVYPPDLVEGLFVGVLGVRRCPSQALLLAALRHAAAHHQPGRAWACLAEVGLTLGGHQAATAPRGATELGVGREQHRPLNGGKLDLGEDGSEPVQHYQEGGEAAVPWLVVLHSEALLPTLSPHDLSSPAPAGVPSTGVLSSEALAAPCSWVTAQQGGLHVWWDQAWGTLTVGTGASAGHQLPQAAVQGLISAAQSTAGQPSLLVLSPTTAQQPTQRQLQGLCVLLGQVLQLPSLETRASVVPSDIHGHILPAPSPPGDAPGAGVPVPTGGVVRPDVIQFLRGAMPLVVRYLAANRSESLALLLGAGQERRSADGLQGSPVVNTTDTTASTGQPCYLGSHSSLSSILRRLIVISLPTLATCTALGGVVPGSQPSLTTPPSPNPAFLDLRGVLEGGAPVLYVSHGQEQHQAAQHTTGAGSRSPPPPPLPTSTWQHCLLEFSRLFTADGSAPDQALSGLLLMAHSLAPTTQGAALEAILSTLYKLAPVPLMLNAAQGTDGAGCQASREDNGSEGEYDSIRDPADLVRAGLAAGVHLGAAAAPLTPAEQQQLHSLAGTTGTTPGNKVGIPGDNMAIDSADGTPGNVDEDNDGYDEDEDGEVIVWGQGAQEDDQPGGRALGGAGAGGVPGHQGDEAPAGEGGRADAGGPQNTSSRGGPGPGPGMRQHLLSQQLPPGEFQEESIEIPEHSRTALAPLPIGPQGEQTAARDAVGRWGEAYVAHLLRERAEPGVVVEWVNEHEEQLLPYDVRVTAPDGKVTYVEVKTTTSRDKSLFEVSHREWLFAQQEGSSYAIYRVFGAGTPDVRVAAIINPYLQWRSARVGVLLAL